jgi:hypothetical protein
MKSPHPQGRTDEPDSLPGSDWPAPAVYLTDWPTLLRLAERACCCCAKPAIVAIVPPGPGRTSASDLLLCRHHYVASERALVDGAAAVFDSEGEPLTPHTKALVRQASNAPAAAAAAGSGDAGLQRARSGRDRHARHIGADHHDRTGRAA